ncbi:hypothetical protein FRB94_002717 [Tulasnella sp. JGI-2019a]|nr:hypothetical protein FRB94_002717 [Tulasnella sp. JGI-2019a]
MSGDHTKGKDLKVNIPMSEVDSGFTVTSHLKHILSSDSCVSVWGISVQLSSSPVETSILEWIESPPLCLDHRILFTATMIDYLAEYPSLSEYLHSLPQQDSMFIPPLLSWI